MKVKILFFAQLREIFKTDSESMELELGSRVEDVVKSLLLRLETPVPGQFPFVFAVNENFVGVDHVLGNEDVLALMTPMAGG